MLQKKEMRQLTSVEIEQVSGGMLIRGPGGGNTKRLSDAVNDGYSRPGSTAGYTPRSSGNTYAAPRGGIGKWIMTY